MNSLKKIKIAGYKSIEELELDFHNLNILIGSNGAGKSNLLSFFEMLHAINNSQFQNYVAAQGGANVLLYNGRKVTKRIAFSICDDRYQVYAHLNDKAGDQLYFSKLGIQNDQDHHTLYAADGLNELQNGRYAEYHTILDSIGVYHFHDTSTSSPMKSTADIGDNIELAPDGRNVAAVLYRIKLTDISVYERILSTIRLAAPYFQDFVLRENPLNPQKIRLEWKKCGCDIPFGADQLSDGTLRFICLVVLLCLPEDMRKEVVLIDEPELGLHPFSITIITELMKKYAESHQVIAATQSVEFINEFQANQIIVAESRNGASVFQRLDEKDLEDWLTDYSIGELWKKNVIGGRP